MSKTVDGGPAFPQGNSLNGNPMSGRGMSLREYFASQAISGLINFHSKLDIKELVKEAYTLADELIEQSKSSGE